MKLIPYPLRAFKISIDICPFTFWWPKYYNFKLSEKAKCEANTLWYIRFACFQISYSRLL